MVKRSETVAVFIMLDAFNNFEARLASGELLTAAASISLLRRSIATALRSRFGVDIKPRLMVGTSRRSVDVDEILTRVRHASRLISSRS